MRIEQQGAMDVSVDADVRDVLAVLEDPSQVAGFVRPLLDDVSTTSRWHVEPVRLGPVVIRPVADVTVTRDGSTVAVVGLPVPRTTRTHLDVRMTVHPHDVEPGRSEVHTDWSVEVELRGPQFVAGLARPMLAEQARFVSDELATALRERFA